MTVERAIKLTEYFKESALSVQNILNENMLNSQQQAIVNLLPPSFTTAQAIQIAEQNGMKERTFQRFLNDNIGTLFRKEKHGEYSKINRDIFVGIDTIQAKTTITTKMTH